MRLPQEAKDMIWEHSIVPRVVRFHRGGSKLGLMYANHDSRTIALKNGYKFLKSERNLNSRERGVPLFGIWVNWDIDIFHLSALFDYYEDSGPIVGTWQPVRRSIRAAMFCKHRFKDWMRKVRRVAVDLEDTNMLACGMGDMMEWNDFADVCGPFSALKELMIVADNPCDLEAHMLVPLDDASEHQRKCIKAYTDATVVNMGPPIWFRYHVNAIVLFMESTANICSGSLRKHGSHGPSSRLSYYAPWTPVEEYQEKEGVCWIFFCCSTMEVRK
jgi:hypothetical protein